MGFGGANSAAVEVCGSIAASESRHKAEFTLALPERHPAGGCGGLWLRGLLAAAAALVDEYINQCYPAERSFRAGVVLGRREVEGSFLRLWPHR